MAKQQGLDLQTVVKDAAQGIAAGTREVFPGAEQRDDCFHAFYEMGKLKQYLERRGYGAISRVEEAQKKLDKAKRTGRGDCEKLVKEVLSAQELCSQILELHDAFEGAMREATEAMEFIDLSTGHIRTADEMETLLKAAADKMIALDHKHCVKVGKYIGNRAPGLALYMNALGKALGELGAKYGDVSICLASIVFRLKQDLERHKRPWDCHRDERHLMGALSMLHKAAGENTNKIIDAVEGVMQKRHRASSAIEGFNAALRPFLYVHKGVSEGFLELFKAYHNLKTRRWGRHKGTSAHEVLTGEKISDWLTMLEYTPSPSLH